jgi:hypothetical protein
MSSEPPRKPLESSSLFIDGRRLEANGGGPYVIQEPARP